MASENPYYNAYMAVQQPSFKRMLRKSARESEKTPLSDEVVGNISTQALTGGLQLASDIGSIAGQDLNLGTPAPQYFAEGIDPSYQGGEYYSRASMIQPQGATGGEILSTAGKAAATGASIGSIIPGIGTAVGAGIGALTGAVGAIVGGGIRRRRQRREKTNALELGKAQQQEFNAAQDAFNQQQAGMASYQQRANPYRRLQNLYQ